MSERTWRINDNNRYFNTENGQRFYIDRNNINGNATWDAEKGLTTKEWDALHTVQEDVQKARSNQKSIGENSLPPKNLPIASSPPKEITYEVTLKEENGKFTVKNTKEIPQASSAVAPPRNADGKLAARSRKTRARKSRSRKTRSRRH